MNKTHEEHVRRVKKRHGNSIRVVGVFTHSSVRVSYKCRQSSHPAFDAFPHNMESIGVCALCSKEKRRKAFEKKHRIEVQRVHGPHVTFVGPYLSAATPAKHRCPRHGVFMARPANVTARRSGCKKCYYQRVSERDRKPHSVYVEEAAAKGLDVLDSYMTALTQIRHRCQRGHVWEARPNDILSGYGCPLCDNSQYKRRPLQLGSREVWIQGSEGKAISALLSDGVDPADIALTKREGKPTFRYRFKGTWRLYVPDMLMISRREIIEVKSSVTLGLYDVGLLAQVRAKTRSVLKAGFGFRLMLIHRGRNIDLGSDWHTKTHRDLVRSFRRLRHAQDLRHRRR